MELRYSESEGGLRLIQQTVKLDTEGFNRIDQNFTAFCAGENAGLLADLSEVTFLASISIRLLTTNAKSLTSRSGQLAPLNPTAEMEKIL